MPLGPAAQEFRKCSDTDRGNPAAPCPAEAFARGLCKYHYRRALRLGRLTARPRPEAFTRLRAWVPVAVERALRRTSRVTGQTISALVRDILKKAVSP